MGRVYLVPDNQEEFRVSYNTPAMMPDLNKALLVQPEKTLASVSSMSEADRQVANAIGKDLPQAHLGRGSRRMNCKGGVLLTLVYAVRGRLCR